MVKVKYDPQVAIVLGSKSDEKKIEKAIKMLKDLNISYEINVISAHRTPNLLKDFVKKLNEPDNPTMVVIAAAGMSAALPGDIAARTLKPVIGVPMSSDKDINTQAAIYSMLCMPSGTPVATVGVDAGENAALLAASILALDRPYLKDALENYRRNLAAKTHAADDELKKIYH